MKMMRCENCGLDINRYGGVCPNCSTSESERNIFTNNDNIPCDYHKNQDAKYSCEDCGKKICESCYYDYLRSREKH